MAFALSPDQGLPRLIRFTTLQSNEVARLDRENNLLLVDKENYKRLTPADQDALFKTHSSLTILEETKAFK